MSGKITAEHVETYASLIESGLNQVDAGHRVGVSYQTFLRRSKTDPVLALRLAAAYAERDERRYSSSRPHGSLTAYKRGCRCDPCRAANAAVHKSNRDRRYSAPLPDRIPHGSASTYSNWGCRCRPCTSAWSAHCAPYRRAYVERQKAKRSRVAS